MEVTIKVRFNSSQEKFENFGGNRYLLYLPFPQDKDSEQVMIELLSRKLGTPSNRIQLKCINQAKDWVFYVE